MRASEAAVPTAWFRSCGCSESCEAALRAQLRSAGIELNSLQSPESAEPFGIICFSEVSDDLLELLHTVRRAHARVIVIAAPDSGEAPPAWRLLHAGASDILSWREGFAIGGQVLAKLERWAAVDRLAEEASARESLIGASSSWLALVRSAVEAARYTSAPLLLTGESGTGKEMLAKLVSGIAGDRHELVTVDCGTLAPELSGSELFGHERGAFTGAHSMRDGAFALANGATLLLDEIGEVPLAIQVQLLRAIQEQSYKRVGGNAWQSTRFRLVCATNRNLEELVAQGRFRLDLYHRIAGCVLRTPPLRERTEDILALAGHFLGASGAGFDPAVEEYLLNRDYPGNVRELRQLVHRMALRHAGDGPITAGDVPEDDRPLGGELRRAWPDDRFENSIADAIARGASLKEISQTTAQVAIKIAVQSEKGNLQRAARRLGITDRALQMRRAAGQLES